MDINRLKEFTHLADTFSFAETARHFYMSQSVLSKSRKRNINTSAIIKGGIAKNVKRALGV